MKGEIIGAVHEFHDKDFVIDWAERFTPTPERLELFNIILSELQFLIPEDGIVIELGIGPGYLANHLLRAMPNIKYCGIDFSQPMLEIAQKRLAPYLSRSTYARLDLVNNEWGSIIDEPINAIVSTWSLHDLGNPDNINLVYNKSYNTLCEKGVFLNGDFIKPDGAIHEFELGRFEIEKHIDMLKKVGFRDVKCMANFETEINSPTPSQNYACFRAIK